MRRTAADVKLGLDAALSPGRRGSKQLRAELEAAEERNAESMDAVEECHEAMREWREYSRREKGWFNRPPEPDASRCDLRALRKRLLAGGAR